MCLKHLLKVIHPNPKAHQVNDMSEQLLILDQTFLDFEDFMAQKLPNFRQSLSFRGMGLIEFHTEQVKIDFQEMLHLLESIIPPNNQKQLVDRSALLWPVYCAHVLSWWLPQASALPFLKAFALIAQRHQIDLEMKWNLRKSQAVAPENIDFGYWLKVVLFSFLCVLFFQSLGLDLPIWLVMLSLIALFYQVRPKQYHCIDSKCQHIIQPGQEACPRCGQRFRWKR